MPTDPMTRARREARPPGGLVLDIRDRPGPPPLRLEAADGRLLLRQGERPVLLGRVDPPRDGLFVHRLDGYRSPLPPLRSALLRDPGRGLPDQYARWLEDSPHGPLHDSRWLLSEARSFPPYVWHHDFARSWPGSHLDWSGRGWQGVVPLRRLSSPDAPRVRAYRKHARDGTSAPVLLWWVSSFDGWLLLDGHDRAVAALAEGRDPVCLVLSRAPDDEAWRRTADEVTAGHERRMARLGARPRPWADRQRATMERAYGDVMSWLPYEHAPTRCWPLPGGPAAWDEIAARVMFECRSD
ncbi:hypothetical protein ABZ612_02770 [Streptomyces avermitilis]|uniref:hypothetical protein n=1 Tax=Streptomyces avermitilis TaxID=33903 RepID=UPI0034097116